ncbi:MAG: hypothetical protein V3W11_09065 [bacterium]
MVVNTPAGLTGIYARDEEEVWLVGEDPPNSSESQALIMLYTAGRIEEKYRLAERGSTFYDIDFYGDTGWAAGDINVAGNYAGLLFKYEGGSWSRVSNVPETRWGFYKVSAYSRDGCWLKGGYEVFRYDRGTWTRFGDFPNARDVAFSSPSRGFITTDLGPYIWVFDGARWVREDVVLPPGFSTTGLADIAPIPGGVLFTCSLRQEGLSDFYYSAILRRDLAPPGEGDYELVFFAPPGPYFYYISALSFADAENGVAVGYLTSVVCENGVYYEEIVTRPFGTPFAVAALAAGDYWMLSKAEGVGHFLARYKK